MFCKVCGKEVNDKAIICPSCGCKINEQEEIAPTAVNETLKLNICCLVGFIFSIASFIITLYGLIAIAGLVLSIVGLVQCGKGGYKLKGLGIAGIIIASLGFIYAIYSIIIALYILSYL